MGSDGARPALPPDVQEGLRVAFAAEVAARLPRLRARSDRDEVLHDVHALASSAWVVGERGISTLARTVEEQLEAAADPTELPALVTALQEWTP